MLLRYLKLVVLKKATKIKQSNGTFINSYTNVGDYKVQTQDLTDDEVSASVYGANITKMLRLSSPLNELEKYLLPKVNNKLDNISQYYIFFDNRCYKIISVSNNRIDIELVNSTSEVISL